MILKLVIALFCWLLAGFCKGIMDTLQFHYAKSSFADRDPLFWNPKVSWRNKYKNGDPQAGPKFPFSTTWLVFLTDAWHLFQTVMLAGYRTVLVLLASLFFDLDLWIWAGIWIGLSLLFSSGFHLSYTLLFKRKAPANP
jgi:hypothetical protein